MFIKDITASKLFENGTTLLTKEKECDWAESKRELEGEKKPGGDRQSIRHSAANAFEYDELKRKLEGEKDAHLTGKDTFGRHTVASEDGWTWWGIGKQNQSIMVMP